MAAARTGRLYSGLATMERKTQTCPRGICDFGADIRIQRTGTTSGQCPNPGSELYQFAVQVFGSLLQAGKGPQIAPIIAVRRECNDPLSCARQAQVLRNDGKRLHRPCFRRSAAVTPRDQPKDSGREHMDSGKRPCLRVRGGAKRLVGQARAAPSAKTQLFVEEQK